MRVRKTIWILMITSLFVYLYFLGFFGHFPLCSYYSYNKVDTLSKLGKLVSTHLIHSVNGTYRSDVFRTWGYVDPKTGQYTGLTGQLKKNEHDVCGNSFENFL